MENVNTFLKTKVKTSFGDVRWTPRAKCDNNAACTALNSRLSGRLSLLKKSSRMNLHWARDQLERSKVLVERVATELNAADLGSKALGPITHNRLAHILMSTEKFVHSDVRWEQGESDSKPSGWVPLGKPLGTPWC